MFCVVLFHKSYMVQIHTGHTVVGMDVRTRSFLQKSVARTVPLYYATLFIHVRIIFHVLSIS